MRHTLCVALLASAMISSSAAAAPAKHGRHPHKLHPPAGIGVVVDQAKMISLARPAKTIYVGNPTIADITIIDGRHAFVLGKTFGVTNLIAMDADGQQISNQQITVVNSYAALTFNDGANQSSYSCTRARCETMPRPGDQAAFVSATESAVTTHLDTSLKNATGAGAGQMAQQ